MATMFQDLMAGLDEIEVILANDSPIPGEEHDETAESAAAKAGLVPVPLRRD